MESRALSQVWCETPDPRPFRRARGWLRVGPLRGPGSLRRRSRPQSRSAESRKAESRRAGPRRAGPRKGGDRTEEIPERVARRRTFGRVLAQAALDDLGEGLGEIGPQRPRRTGAVAQDGRHQLPGSRTRTSGRIVAKQVPRRRCHASRRDSSRGDSLQIGVWLGFRLLPPAGAGARLEIEALATERASNNWA